MIKINLPKYLEDGLENLVQETGHTKNYFITKALKQFLENRADYLLAVTRLKENNPRIPYEQVIKELKLED